MSLHASASESVTQDTVTITIRAEVEAANQVLAGQKLNVLLSDLMKRAESVKAVQARTGNYDVWSNYDKGALTSASGRGSIILKSTNFAAARALAGKLSDKAAISNIAFTLSQAKQDVVEHQLLNQAAKAFRERALAATTAFGFSRYQIHSLTLGGDGRMMPPSRPFFTLNKLSRESTTAPADVPLEPGVTIVSIDVNGTIVLQ
jgi:predicted secreted protein